MCEGSVCIKQLQEDILRLDSSLTALVVHEKLPGHKGFIKCFSRRGCGNPAVTSPNRQKPRDMKSLVNLFSSFNYAEVVGEGV